jgi:hypothetical protein
MPATPEEVLAIIQALDPGRRIVWLRATVDSENKHKYTEKEE